MICLMAWQIRNWAKFLISRVWPVGSFGNINEFAYELDMVSLSLNMRIRFLIDLFKLLFEWKTKDEIDENDICSYRYYTFTWLNYRCMCRLRF